ncbi:synaptonemal complex protein 1-like [Hibiscus syriacus]|uniref:synaptonemal complex protein 1-like n=1 Tax=Hibiscus syriacus TaxID=106335 RepID=UPI0019211A31|nr:synaptonemal complex protein 1-like [Hibiscus syriacus]
MKALRCQFEDECKKLQEELSLQKTKEDRQRALLQLQWKVMSDKPQEEQEVNSRRDYSIPSVKKNGSGFEKRTQHALVRPEEEEKQSPFAGVTQTPVSKLLKKVENTNTGSVMSIPKHHKKVTHHEYEVETSNGRTITKRRKRSTVLFEDPRKKKVRTPKTNNAGSFVQDGYQLAKQVRDSEYTGVSGQHHVTMEGELGLEGFDLGKYRRRKLGRQ